MPESNRAARLALVLAFVAVALAAAAFAWSGCSCSHKADAPRGSRAWLVGPRPAPAASSSRGARRIPEESEVELSVEEAAGADVSVAVVPASAMPPGEGEATLPASFNVILPNPEDVVAAAAAEALRDQPASTGRDVTVYNPLTQHADLEVTVRWSSYEEEQEVILAPGAWVRCSPQSTLDLFEFDGATVSADVQGSVSSANSGWTCALFAAGGDGYLG